jgi:hypothetical protein
VRASTTDGVKGSVEIILKSDTPNCQQNLASLQWKKVYDYHNIERNKRIFVRVQHKVGSQARLVQNVEGREAERATGLQSEIRTMGDA